MSKRSIWRHRNGRLKPLAYGVITIAAAVVLAASGTLVAVALADRAAAPDYAATFTPKPMPTSEPAPVVAFIGDSYTAGAGGTAGGFVPLLAQANGWAAQSLGRGGTGFIIQDTQDPANSQAACGQDYCENYPEMIAAAAELAPDIVVVSGGRNNVSAKPAEIQSAIQSFYEQLRAALPSVTIVATSPLWDASTPPATLQVIADAERAAVESVGGYYLDIGQPLAGSPDLLAADGVHPNDAGYEAIAAAIRSAWDAAGLPV